MSTKAEVRRRVLLRVLARSAVTHLTQEQIRELLRREGQHVTQATVSRDLVRLGLSHDPPAPLPLRALQG